MTKVSAFSENGFTVIQVTLENRADKYFFDAIIEAIKEVGRQYVEKNMEKITDALDMEDIQKSISVEFTKRVVGLLRTEGQSNKGETS